MGLGLQAFLGTALERAGRGMVKAEHMKAVALRPEVTRQLESAVAGRNLSPEQRLAVATNAGLSPELAEAWIALRSGKIEPEPAPGLGLQAMQRQNGGK